MKAPTRETQLLGNKASSRQRICLVGAVSALASDRWEEAGSGAVAILPAPKPVTGFGGSLFCAEQRWGFLFRTTSEAGLPTGGIEKAKISVGSDNLELDAEISPGSVKVAVPARYCCS